MPKSVTFCEVLSNSTQKGSAPGCGKTVPLPTFWFSHRKGFSPFQGPTGSKPLPGGCRRKRGGGDCGDEHRQGKRRRGRRSAS